MSDCFERSSCMCNCLNDNFFRNCRDNRCDDRRDRRDDRLTTETEEMTGAMIIEIEEMTGAMIAGIEEMTGAMIIETEETADIIDMIIMITDIENNVKGDTLVSSFFLFLVSFY